jgi:hypothetical protein
MECALLWRRGPKDRLILPEKEIIIIKYRNNQGSREGIKKAAN